FQDDAVRMASIGHPNETMLAEKTRELQASPSRWLTDLILGKERTFTTQLVGRGPYSEYYGDLSITLDTATYGQGFIVSSVIIFISGVLRALAMGLVLYLVYHWLLTKPLSRIIEHLTTINPDRPSEHQIPLLKGHERNELGIWINTANQLLASIERNTHLRHEDGDSTEKLLQKAEQTMTLAKSRSRNRYQFYIASVDSEMRRRRELEKDLREALSREQFHLVYQPQISYRDHRVVGVEALLRWQHPEHGFVPPDLFIPLAEQNGTIIAIGEWVLDQACRQLREWHDLGFSDLRMAVNLSTVQLHHAELPRVVNNLLQIYRLPPRSLELEVTETGLMEDISTAAQHLLSLRRSGALIAIDDFGTGYSSLSYLKSLPLDKIKIDKSFVQDLLDDDDDATIVRAIIQLGKSLGMQVIAEGVETAEQEAYIISEGCHEGQGYHYSKPLPARELSAYLKQAQRSNAAIL
ncbi:putative bifunctional diguanylate cyclase/phosphodiesterase, partial [Pseudomonas chlororaphis]|uniref:putative bifunctional diguanylate cyclase/phosphodiesterase n=1 Tax=Pseudomonas chlororaphis TaxID=587753 RepID=UPI001FF09A03